MTSPENIDCAVGAGVVGLAVARALAMAGREVVVLEAAGAIGTGTSSRNSEVIHAGSTIQKIASKPNFVSLENIFSIIIARLTAWTINNVAS